MIPFVVRLYAEPVRLHIRGQLYRLIPPFDAYVSTPGHVLPS